eukprot:Phypoly_transcript_12718.p1 GENE.Phypoly_transcript_12718~~Phypoly_transcript_12718.p1  ORF type:complete len:238 (+),score=69.13 Phypoly_transcript_12718:319-1032(+)
MNTNPTMNTTSTYPTAIPAQQAGAYPAGTTSMGATQAGDPAHPPSAIKGNITAMMGKMQHNPTKEQNGNIMISNAAEQKAAKFETKALQWESKGNTVKAQKNREKAARYRQKAAAKLAQPLSSAQTAKPIGAVGTAGPSPLKSDKAARCEAKALEYERKGNLAKAQKNRERAWRIREKNSIPHPVGAQHPSTYAGYTQNMTAVPTTSGTTFVPSTTAGMNTMPAAPTTTAVPPATRY